MPAYQAYHAEQLAHQSEEALFNSFFTGRVAEVLLKTLNQSQDNATVIESALKRLNDYVGYRPVATLASKELEPYPHEWIRPIPLYVDGAGAATGQYQEVIELAIELLKKTDPALLRAAYFIPEHLTELAIDPRAYDFDHPANRRPNHQFGLWDPHYIDGDGYYRRFIVQQLNLDCLFLRFRSETPQLPLDELLFEAAAVLAGTILMASGISGYGPETHDSTVTLSQLLVRIAAYRDEFYRQLINGIDGPHGARLRAEARQLQQPFGGARQALNRELTNCRALQLQRVHLTRIYARMDHADAAEEQAQQIRVPSARINCRIDCNLTAARRLLAENQLASAFEAIEATRADILLGIDCGALVDPWNILGFDANFSLFGQIENSIRDYRVDDLIVAVEEMMELYAQIWSKAVALDHPELADQLRDQFTQFAHWWHQFAAHEMDSVDAENPMEVLQAASHVVEALRAWHQQGEAAGDIRFWAPHVQEFDSCRAYWLVINTLLLRDDKDASLGLMMHWLSQSDRIPLEHGETSFYQLSLRWLAASFAETGAAPADEQGMTGWRRIRKFFDYLEANAGDQWQVPEFETDANSTNTPLASTLVEEDAVPEEDDDDELFQAAYENVVYRDSTDDGMDGSVFDFETPADHDEIQQASREIVNRMAFIDQFATIWKMVALLWYASDLRGDDDARHPEIAKSIRDLIASNVAELRRKSTELNQLMSSIHNYRLNRAGSDLESMVEYDRMRVIKESLLDQIITASVSVREAVCFLEMTFAPTASTDESQDPAVTVPVRLLQACIRGDRESAQQYWDQLADAWVSTGILYVPLNRGGNPQEIATIRARHQMIQNLMFWMPRLGMLTETYGLVGLVRSMESIPAGPGAITEFDDLFEMACRSLVSALVESREHSKNEGEVDNEDEDIWLISCLEDMIEPLLRTWLDHSRTLRLSVLEQVMDDKEWKKLVEFIRNYGRDIFTQRFLHLGNVRGILHQGVDSWLEKLVETGDEEQYGSLIDALENGLSIQEAEDKFTLILEAIVENYSEYRDYNSTTTQSDQGDQLYSLLDFLRLRVSYDRVMWNLNPVIVAHQVLVERQCDNAAEMWRSRLEERIGPEAKRHETRLQKLQQKYAMRLPSIAKRLSERFMRPLLIDHVCSLIGPATDNDSDQRDSAFSRIQEQANEFLDEPSGAGLDVPAWLMAMEEVVRATQFQQTGSTQEIMQELLSERMAAAVKLPADKIQEQVSTWMDDDS